MPFASFTYVAFLLLAIPFVRMSKGSWRERIILGASFVYYAAWDVRMLLVLVGIGVLTYYADARIARGAKTIRDVVIPIAIILLVLAVFKYTGMIGELVNLVLPASATIDVPDIVL